MDTRETLEPLIQSKRTKLEHPFEKPMKLTSLPKKMNENSTYKYQPMFQTRKQKTEKFDHLSN